MGGKTRKWGDLGIPNMVLSSLALPLHLTNREKCECVDKKQKMAPSRRLPAAKRCLCGTPSGLSPPQKLTLTEEDFMPQEGRVWKDRGCAIDLLSSCFKTHCPFCDICRSLSLKDKAATILAGDISPAVLL